MKLEEWMINNTRYQALDEIIHYSTKVTNNAYTYSLMPKRLGVDPRIIRRNETNHCRAYKQKV